MKANRKTDQIFIRCEPAIKRELQALARVQERTVSQVVHLAIRAYLAKVRDEGLIA